MYSFISTNSTPYINITNRQGKCSSQCFPYYLQNLSYVLHCPFFTEFCISLFFLQNLPHPWLVIDDAHVNMVPLFRHINNYVQSGDYLIWEDTNPLAPHTFIGECTKETRIANCLIHSFPVGLNVTL